MFLVNGSDHSTWASVARELKLEVGSAKLSLMQVLSRIFGRDMAR